MDQNEDFQEEHRIEEASKRSVERSAAYPAVSIEEALAFSNELYKAFRSEYTKRDTISKVVESSSINRTVGAAGHYGFLEREKDSYRISELYKTIFRNLSDNDTAQALLRAFYNPKLYKELVDKYDGDELPTRLAPTLAAFHRITDSAAPFAAEVFLENARFVGVLGEDNVLNYKRRALELSDPDIKIGSKGEDSPFRSAENTYNREVPSQEKGDLFSPPAVVQQPIEEASQTTSQKLLPEVADGERLSIKLTGGKYAYLTYPRDLNEKDFEILRLQLQALALTI